MIFLWNKKENIQHFDWTVEDGWYYKLIFKPWSLGTKKLRNLRGNWEKLTKKKSIHHYNSQFVIVTVFRILLDQSIKAKKKSILSKSREHLNQILMFVPETLMWNVKWSTISCPVYSKTTFLITKLLNCTSFDIKMYKLCIVSSVLSVKKCCSPRK